jgi:CubicO group peptidase (beta-lactamase class C family)
MRKKITYASLIVILIIAICSLSAYKLRVNHYGLPPLKTPQSELVQRGDYSYLKEFITDHIQKRIQQENVVGLSIALVNDQKLVWAEGFGYQNKEDNIKATDKSIYHLGSVTKVITATAIMQLVERGMIDLDKPIRAYVPEFNIKSRFSETSAITVRTLLSHHSGLPGDRLINQFARKPHEPFSIVLKHFENEYAAYPPDHVWAYCNLGYNLLGVIVERVSGMSYEKFIRQNIFLPLGMQNTAVNKDQIPSGLYSKVYRAKTNNGYWQPYFRDSSAGGLLSSVYEMSLFMRMVLNQGSLRKARILKQETLEEMLKVQNGDISLDLGFKIGLGWYLDRICFRYAGRYCGHAGDFAVAHTLMNLLPDHKLGVIVTANTDTAAVIVREIADLALQLALETKTGLKPPNENHKRVNIAKSELHEFEGLYATLFGLYRIKTDNDQLKLKVEEEGARLPWLTLIRHDDGWFSVQFPLHTIPNFRKIKYPLYVVPDLRLFITKVDNKKYMYIERLGDQYPIGEAFENKPVPDIWRERAGTYEVTNFDPAIDTNIYPNWQIIYEDGILFFKSKKKLVIEPVNDQEAIIFCLGRNCHETVHFKIRDGQEILKYAGLEYKKVD